MKQAWVYILECSDKSYYTGSTTNLQQRTEQHKAGTFDGYTAFRRPVKLLWHQEFSDIRYAIEAERKIKGWTRAKKEALMRSDFDALHELSRSSKTKRKINEKHPSTPSLRSVAQDDISRLTPCGRSLSMTLIVNCHSERWRRRRQSRRV